MLTDENIRKEAVRPDQSFIVQAPAGSGKTSLLVKRFINLLGICKEPEECLAITFTKKAAIEMRYRILQTIEQEVLFNKQRLVPSQSININNTIYRQVLDNPNRLKILTIDAFCASLTQKMPIMSRLGVNLNVAEDPEKLYAKAVDQLFKESYPLETKSNSITTILEYLNNDYGTIKNLFIAMLAKREQWLPLIVPIKKHLNVKEILENNLRLAIEELLRDLLNYLPDQNIQNKIINIAKQAAYNVKQANIDNSIIFCRNLAFWPAPTIDSLPVWQGLTELLLNKTGEVRKQVTINQGFLAPSTIKHLEDKKIAAELKHNMQDLLQDISDNHKKFIKKLQQIITLPDLIYSEKSWEFLQNIFNLLPELVAHLTMIFQEEQQIDFAQIAIAALHALGSNQDPTDLALLIDYKLNHILVDEFQDTSILQFNLLENLVANWQDGDGRTIFLVGDPMQSIYRFRQADVSLFLKAQRYGVSNIKLKNLYLTTNFRSTKTIVNNLNKLFVNIFPTNDDLILGGVSYSAAEVSNNSSDNESSKVQFFLTENNQLETEGIIKLIKDIKQANFNKGNTNHTIAILVRAKAHANYIIEALRANNIKFQANELEPLAGKELICDLIVLTKAILHVHDTIAWLSLLRGPLVGLRLVDLHALRESREPSLFLELQKYSNNSKLSDDAKLRLSYILPILFNAIAQRENSINLSKLIKKTWVALGGYLLINKEETSLVEDFFYALLKVKNFNDMGGLEEFLEKQFASNTLDLDLGSVQIMTIHKSKGLEFDTVIVPGMNRRTLTTKKQLLLWEQRSIIMKDNENKSCLLIAPINPIHSQGSNSIYDFINIAEKEREIYEEQRLLYVALTRAKKNFYGFGSKKEDEIISGYIKNFFGFLEPHTKFEELPYSLLVNKSDKKNNKVVLRRISTDWYKKNIIET